MTKLKLRNSLYKAARLLGDAQAMTSPARLTKRLVRKSLWKTFAKLMNKAVR